MKKLLFRFLLGAAMGIALLMVSYLGIYYIAGEEAFVLAVSQLTDINIFQNQLLVISLAGITMTFALHLVEKTLSEDSPSPFMFPFSLFILMLCFMTSILFIKNLSTFDEAIKNMLIIVTISIFSLYALVHCCQEVIDEFIINKKLKEKNR